jgi:quercetin dioxygenase-like cupin family protein
LLSGKATFTVEGKSTELSAGDFIVIPAKAHHQLKCGAGAECVLFTRRAGPTDYHFDT